MTNEKHFPKTASQWEFDYGLLTNYAKKISWVSCPVWFCLITRHWFINIVHDCLSKQKFFLTHPSPLQTSLFCSVWSLSRSFNAKIMWVQCVKVLNWTLFGRKTILLVWFRSKNLFRKLSMLVGGDVLTKLSFWGKIIDFYRNWIITKHVKRKRKSFRESRT